MPKVAAVSLSDAGRLWPADAHLRSFGERVAFESGRLIVSAFDTRARHVVLSIFGVDAGASSPAWSAWSAIGRFDVPLECPEATGGRFEATRVGLRALGAGIVGVDVRHELLARSSGDPATNTSTAWAGTFDVERGAFEAVGTGAVLARRTEDGAHVHEVEGKVVVEGPDGVIVLDDPDRNDASGFGASAVITRESIWVAASGAFGSSFQPRLHAFERSSGTLQRSITLQEGVPGLGVAMTRWKEGLLLSSLYRGQAMYVPFGHEAPILIANAKWEKSQHGFIAGETNVSAGDAFAAIGAPYASAKAGGVVLIDANCTPFAQVKLADAKRNDSFGQAVAASGPWLAASFRRGDDAAVQIARIDGTSVSEAKIAFKLRGAGRCGSPT